MKYLICMDDFDVGLRFTDDRRMFRRQQAYHRITNRSVFGFTDAAVNFGIDVTELIGQPAFDVANAIEEAVGRDAWVTSVTANVSTEVVDGETSYTISIIVESQDDDTFDLTIKAAKEQVELL